MQFFLDFMDSPSQTYMKWPLEVSGQKVIHLIVLNLRVVFQYSLVALLFRYRFLFGFLSKFYDFLPLTSICSVWTDFKINKDNYSRRIFWHAKKTGKISYQVKSPTKFDCAKTFFYFEISRIFFDDIVVYNNARH